MSNPKPPTTTAIPAGVPVLEQHEARSKGITKSITFACRFSVAAELMGILGSLQSSNIACAIVCTKGELGDMASSVEVWRKPVLGNLKEDQRRGYTRGLIPRRGRD